MTDPAFCVIHWEVLGVLLGPEMLEEFAGFVAEVECHHRGHPNSFGFQFLVY